MPAVSVRSPAILSGRWRIALLGACFVMTGVLIPAAAHLPIWIEFELVAGVWWVLWAGVLAWLLFAGRSADAGSAAGVPTGWRIPPFRLRWVDFVISDRQGTIGEALLSLVVGGMLIVAASVLIWLVLEIAIPLVAALAYMLVHGMLARVADCHGAYAGRFGPALSRAGLWASVYTLPLALAVWAVHLLALR